MGKAQFHIAVLLYTSLDFDHGTKCGAVLNTILLLLLYLSCKSVVVDINFL